MPSLEKPENSSLNSARVLAYFENARRVHYYLQTVEAWKSTAESLAGHGIEPPAPPVPPRKAEPSVTPEGNAALIDGTEPVYSAPEPICAIPTTPAGMPAVDSTCYQFPADYTVCPLRIFAKTAEDTILIGTVVELSGIAGIKDGKYRRGLLPAGSMFGGGQQAIYDPA